MQRLLIKNGRVIDPANNVNQVTDVLIENGVISKVGVGLKPTPTDVVINAEGTLVLPGLVDMHVHFRQPGGEGKETILTGSQAAVRGGVTSVCTMPNTQPVSDNRQIVEFVLAEAQKAQLLHLYPAAAITKGLEGKELTEIADLKAAGVVAITDDGHPVMNAEIMRRAMEYARMCGVVVISHSEDLSLTEHGVMNEGIVATRMGLCGMPNMSEAVMVAREILLAELTGAHIHCTHISTKESVDLIRQAKTKGVRVTCDATPHHLTLTEESVIGYNTNMKMNPPLRTRADIEALRQGLKEGIIDAVATDHAPHSESDKDVEFDHAPFGVIGLETSLGVIAAELVGKGELSWSELVLHMSTKPSEILGIPAGTLSPGRPADIILVDPQKKWKVIPEEFRSKSRNSPFVGWELQGKVIMTICCGEIVYKETTDKELQNKTA